jgi:clan AA aspartic protease (TIGR02281 family)
VLGLAVSCLAVAAERIEYRDGRLSVDLERVPIARVLAILEARARLRYQLDPSVSGRISARFADLPLEEGVRRLLSGYSHVLVLDEAAEPTVGRVIVLGVGDEDSLLPEAHVATGEETAAVVTLGRTEQEAPRELVLRRQASGQYLAQGYVNGVAARFLVDTGATTVAIPAELASRAGLRQGRQQIANTAGGQTVAYQTTVAELRVGDLSARNVRAHVVPELAGHYVLLGMSFLVGYDLHQGGERLVIRER